MRHTRLVLAAAGLAGMAASGPAHAAAIHTAGETGAYHQDFCPQLSKALKKSKFDYQCTTSEGSSDNIERVTRNPKDIGFAQFDIYALQNSGAADAPLTTLRSDLGRECLFVVTKNKEFQGLDSLPKVADTLRLVLPPEKSGSAGTYEYLKKVDPNGLGRIRNVSHAKTIDAALEEVIEGDENIATLFVQFPDPANPRFKLVTKTGAKSGAHFVPVISRDILRQELGGEKVYYAQETEIAAPTLTQKSANVITACTPLVLFTGAPEAVEKAPNGQTPDKAKAEQTDLIKTVKALDREELTPKQGFLSGVWRRTKELSADAVEKMYKLSEEAQPYVEKAKEAGKAAVEKAKELGEKAKEKAGEAADAVKEKLGGEAKPADAGDGKTAK